MTPDEVRKIAEDVYNQMGTRYGVAQVPVHTHNNIDTVSFPFTNLSDVPTSYGGSAGKVPTVNATETGMEFSSGGGSPGGNDMDIQFNNSGSFDGSDTFRYSNQHLYLGNDDSNDDEFNITGTSAQSGGHKGTKLVLEGGDGNAGGAGGYVDIRAGNGDSGGSGSGGNLFLDAGSASPNDGDGGAIQITSGSSGTNSGNGGDIQMIAANGYDNPGYIYINAGSVIGGAGVNGGDIYISGGSGDTSANHTGDLWYRGQSGYAGAESMGHFVIVGSNMEHHQESFYVITTDATPLTTVLATINSSTTSPCLVEVHVAAIRQSGSSGSSGDGAGYVLRAMYTSVLGSVALIGSVQQDFVVESQPGWNATLVLSGSDIQLQVTGAADNTILWGCFMGITTNASGIQR